MSLSLVLNSLLLDEEGGGVTADPVLVETAGTMVQAPWGSAVSSIKALPAIDIPEGLVDAILIVTGSWGDGGTRNFLSGEIDGVPLVEYLPAEGEQSVGDFIGGSVFYLMNPTPGTDLPLSLTCSTSGMWCAATAFLVEHVSEITGGDTIGQAGYSAAPQIQGVGAEGTMKVATFTLYDSATTFTLDQTQIGTKLTESAYLTAAHAVEYDTGLDPVLSLNCSVSGNGGHFANVFTLVGTEGSGPVEITGETAETLGLTDEQSATIEASAETTETLTLTDSQQGAALATAAAADTLTLSDAQASALTLPAAASETLTLTDSATAIAAFPIAVSETLVLVDSQIGVQGGDNVIAETLTLTDTQAATYALRAAAAETLSLADTQASTQTAPSAVSEALTLTDTAAGGLTTAKAVSETLTLVDEQQAGRDLLAAASDTLTFADSASAVPVLLVEVTESLILVDTYDSAAAVISAAITEALTLADSANATGGQLVLDIQASIPASRSARGRAQSDRRRPNTSTAHRRPRDGT